MDLIFTSYQNRLPRHEDSFPDWLKESNSLCAVSSQNILLFTTSVPLTDYEEKIWGNYVYCTDLNTPWDCNLVCALSAPATCLAWDGSGTKFVLGDSDGHVYVWRMAEFCITEWIQIYSAQYDFERFIRAEFIGSHRVVMLNTDKKDSINYQEKYLFGHKNEKTYETEGCVLVSSSGLLVAIVFQEEDSLVDATACVGRGRRKICHADMASSITGDFLLAASDEETPITVFSISYSLNSQGMLDLCVATHSSISIPSREDSDPVRISDLKFVLSDSSQAVVVGLESPEGGRVQMWELEHTEILCHKLFASQASPAVPRHRMTPVWRYSDEFSGGGSRVVGLATPRSSVMGGEKPACYVAVGFADGSIQCLIRDSLQQIASVELPKGGNISTNNSNKNTAVRVTICEMCFTATGTALVVTDSLGQLYLYRMSPIADPGGPHVAPYLVTMYEYCLVSGRDWWDLALAARQTNVQDVCDKLEGTFSKQVPGIRSYCFWRYMSIRASLYRLCSSSQYRAADSLGLLMLKSISGDFKSVLQLDPSKSDQDPVENFEIILRNSTKSFDLDTIISSLVASGYVRDLNIGYESVEYIQQLTHWLLTLALHVLAAVPEFKTRRGPGFWLLQEGGLIMLRECLLLIRLWGISRVGFITREKDIDLVAKLFSMVTRLGENKDDEALLDECLMLPSQVIVPAIDTRVSAKGVLSALQCGYSLPFSFYYGMDPDLSPPAQPPFLEGLPYTEDPGCKYFYDSIRKCAMGQSPPAVKQCTRCNLNTQGNMTSKSAFGKSWEKRWSRNCSCGGSWKIVKVD